MFRNIILWMLVTVIFSACKNKYKAAFEEIDKRGYYYYPIEGDRNEISLLTDAIRYKPDLYELYDQRALHYQALGEYEKALKDYQMCVDNHFTSGQIYLYKGICEYKLNQPDIALQDLKLARQQLEQEWKESPIDDRPNHWEIDIYHQRQQEDSTIKATTEAIYHKKSKPVTHSN